MKKSKVIDRTTSILATIIVIVLICVYFSKSVRRTELWNFSDSLSKIEAYAEADDSERADMIKESISKKYGIEVVIKPDESIVSDAKRNAMFQELSQTLAQMNHETLSNLNHIYICPEYLTEEIAETIDPATEIVLGINIDTQN